MDYYRVLEITEQAGEEQIKQAYRRLAKKYHPDLNPDNPEAEEKFKNIAKAYEILGDTVKRKAYDLTRRQPVIYGNPERGKSKSNQSEHNKVKRTKAEYDKAEQSKAEHGKAGCCKGRPDSEVFQHNDTKARENRSDFTKDLEKYFGFSFEEGKKVVKEQDSQKEQEDSLDLTEIFKMFMKLK